MSSAVPGLNFDQKKLKDICEKYHVQELRIFGSYAKGNFTDDSDVDVLYKFYEDSGIGLNIISFAEELEELFGRDVDIVPIEYADPVRHRNMLDESVALYDAA
ncbi:MAG: nucleotidyltransferase domain-containing protein [Acidimicrobiia bacterium]